VDPVQDRLLRKSGSAGNRTRTSGSVATNSDHWTREGVVACYHRYETNLFANECFIGLEILTAVIMVDFLD
jgi:hypothetical protein